MGFLDQQNHGHSLLVFCSTFYDLLLMYLKGVGHKVDRLRKKIDKMCDILIFRSLEAFSGSLQSFLKL